MKQDSCQDQCSCRFGVLAVRHAPILASGLCVGDADVPCAMTAEDTAESIMRWAGERPFAGVWTSPRSRCLHPARVLAGRLGLPLHVDERLREICSGAWQGRPWSVIEASDPMRLCEWLANWTEVAPPGGESVTELLGRVRSWWSGLPLACHLLVGHAGVMRALRVIARGDSWARAMHECAPFLQGEWFAAELPRGDRA